MDTGGSPNLLMTLLSAITGLLGGVVGAWVNYVFGRPKTRAEIAKLQAETQEILQRVNTFSNISATTTYKSADTTERIIYDSSSNKNIGYDFSTGRGNQKTKVVDGKDIPISDKALGDLKFDAGGVLTIERKNTEGWFETWLQRYSYDGEVKKYIPQEPNANQRIFRLSFEARAIGGGHTLRFVFKNQQGNKWLAFAEKPIPEDTWKNFDLYFHVSQIFECRLRIDDIEVSKVPSSVQIRNIILAEKTD